MRAQYNIDSQTQNELTMFFYVKVEKMQHIKEQWLKYHLFEWEDSDSEGFGEIPIFPNWYRLILKYFREISMKIWCPIGNNTRTHISSK